MNGDERSTLAFTAGLVAGQLQKSSEDGILLVEGVRSNRHERGEDDPWELDVFLQSGMHIRVDLRVLEEPPPLRLLE